MLSIIIIKQRDNTVILGPEVEFNVKSTNMFNLNVILGYLLMKLRDNVRKTPIHFRGESGALI